MNIAHTIFAIVGIALLGFGYYAISPLFRNVRVDDALPQMPNPPVTATTTTPASSGVEVLATASVVPTPAHPASGTAKLIRAGDATYLRYEDYKTLNGPDIYVYLAKDLEAKEFVSLGRVKATEGNINYEIPPEVRVEDYPYALTWCKAFGVLFNSADISQL